MPAPSHQDRHLSVRPSPKATLPPPRTIHPSVPYIALVGCTLVWGLNSHAVTIATQTLSAQGFLLLRFATAACIFPVLLLLPGPWRKKAPPSDKRHDLARRDLLSASYAAALLGTAYYLQSVGFTRGDAILTVFLSSTCVLWVPLIVWVTSRRRERIPRRSKHGVLLSCAGLSVAHGFSFDAVTSSAVFALVASLAFAGEIVLVTKVSTELTPGGLARWILLKLSLIAVGFSLVCLLTSSGLWAPGVSKDAMPAEFSEPHWWIPALVFSGVFATAIALYVSAWSTSVRKASGHPAIPATSRGVIENLDAPFTLLFALAFFPWNASVSWWSTGLLLIFAGVLWSEWPRTNEDSKP